MAICRMPPSVLGSPRRDGPRRILRPIARSRSYVPEHLQTNIAGLKPHEIPSKNMASRAVATLPTPNSVRESPSATVQEPVSPNYDILESSIRITNVSQESYNFV